VIDRTRYSSLPQAYTVVQQASRPSDTVTLTKWTAKQMTYSDHHRLSLWLSDHRTLLRQSIRKRVSD